MRLHRDWSGHDPRPKGTRAPWRRPRNPLIPILLCLGFLGCASTLPSPSYPTSRFVLHTESSPDEAEAIIRGSEAFLSDLEEYLGLEAPPPGQFMIVHFRRRWDLWSYLGKELPELRWRKGACFETSQAYVLALSGRPGKECFQRILRHELSHFCLASHFSDFPPWIDEGLSQVLSDGPPFPDPGAANASASPTLPEASSEAEACLELLRAEPGQMLTRSQYELARRITLWLLLASEDSIQRLLRFLEISGPDRESREVFLDAWGMSFEDACSATIKR